MQETNYTIAQIAAIIKGDFKKSANKDCRITNLVTDSRKVGLQLGDLFFAIKTFRNDGARYLLEAYQKGIRNFVVQTQPEILFPYDDVNVLRVDDTLAALQHLATVHRKQFQIPVIGITGSNGKTIVKEWLFQMLCPVKKVIRNPKSYNSQIGVPLSVWKMDAGHEIGIFEAGISQPHEMRNLQRIIEPTIGIFTNIGHAHDEGFESMTQKISEKMQLFSDVETLIYCSDHPWIAEFIQNAKKKIPVFSWGYSLQSNLQLIKAHFNGTETILDARFNGSQISMKIPFTDEASVENATHCWATLLLLGFSNDFISSRMAELQPIAMRLEMKEGKNNCTIINDSYNSDLESLAIAIDLLNQQNQHPKKTIILSDIFQSGQPDELLYNYINTLLVNKKIDRLIGIGEAISGQRSCFSMEKSFYESTQAFLDSPASNSFLNEAVLLKGSRRFEFERIFEVLQQKTHETVLEIDLNALIANLNYYHSLLKPGVKTMVLVKAFSYGSGGFEIANKLQFHRVDYLAVAYADEGVELRQSGITMPIMVMNPDEASFESMIKYRLEPEIYSFRVLKLLADVLKRIPPEEGEFGIHLKLDTGMKRLGFEQKDLPGLLPALKNIPQLRIQSVFSHLAAADNPERDEFTRHQIRLFTQMAGTLCSEFDYKILCHIANTAGASRFPEAQWDMIRLGIGLYGVAPLEKEQEQLQNVSTLRTIISQIKQIDIGETVGYNQAWKATRKTTVATLPVGYADGLNRRLSNERGHVWIHGQLVPFIGNVCMDMCMVDITGVPANEGDPVIVFGKELPVQKMAEALQTIPYEILTGISRRVKRVYFEE